MWTLHHSQNAIAPTLYWQVQEAHELRRVFVHCNNVIRKFEWVASGKADTIDAVNGGDQTQ
ncbi:Uncharacterised protein [Vibrio cholerae]|nr:Uncharacterised protein [Vibrio cholerae]CSC80952.1 Uncharacterised protein [Vibrio cholerae]